jgi:hypothetical protein
MTAILATALLGPHAAAQSAGRNKIGVPASTIFKSMLRFAAAGESDKVERSLELLKPVLAEHVEAYGVSPASAVLVRVRSRETEKALDGIRELVVRDAAVLLRPVPAAPLDRARTLTRTAALEWRIVEEDLGKVAPRRTESIAQGFRDLFEAVETRDEAQMRSAVGRVDKALLGLFAGSANN